jgi:hypothetical protein
MKSRKTSLKTGVAGILQARNSYHILLRTFEGKTPFWRARSKWGDNYKMGCRWGCG